MIPVRHFTSSIPSAVAAALLGAVVVPPSSVSAGEKTTFQALGGIDGCEFYEVTAVSGDGSTVVGSCQGYMDILHSRAFRWSQQAGMIDLGTLPGNLWANAHAVNEDGSVVVGQSWGQLWGGDVVPQPAFLWTTKGGMTSLGTLPGELSSVARSVSGDGSVVVGYSGSEAFHWTAESGMTGLGLLNPDLWISWATAISADGEVIAGSAFNGDDEPDAFRWTGETGMVSITLGTPSAVSADGSIIAGNRIHGAPTLTTGWLWIEGEGLSTITYEFRVNAINADGTTAVGKYVGVGNYGPCPSCDAFIWTLKAGIVNLQEYLSDSGINLDGWTLWEATGISADGRTIVGNGVNPNGGSEGWIATVPPITAPCPGDLTGNGSVGVVDLLALLACWGPVDPAPGNECEAADLTGNANVGVADLLDLLAQWGPCP